MSSTPAASHGRLLGWLENDNDVGIWERARPEGSESEGSGEGIESIERRDEERRDGGKDRSEGTLSGRGKRAER